MKKMLLGMMSFIMLFGLFGIEDINAQTGAPVGGELTITEKNYLDEIYRGDFDVSSDDLGEVISVSRVEEVFSPKETELGRATIKPSLMRLYTVVSVHSANTTRFVYKVTVIADWQDSPVWLFNDVLAASWGNNLSLEDRSISMKYTSGATVTKKTLYKSTPNKGAAFEVPMNGGNNGYLTSATANFYISHPGGGAPRTNVASGYAHKKISFGSIGVELGSSSSIGFSLVGAFDSAHDSIVFGS